MAIRQESKSEDIQIRKEEVKFSLFSDEIYKKILRNALKFTVIELTKVTKIPGYKINIQNHSYLYKLATSHLRMILKIIPLE